MATIKNDLGLNGRVGNVVFYKVGDKTFVRMAGKVNNPNTEKQREVRSRFQVAIRFYQKLKKTSLSKVLKISARGICCNGYMFYMLNNLKVFRADGSIGDFSQLQFSAGKRQRAYRLKGRIDERGEVVLRWSNDEKKCMAEQEDRLMVLALCEGRVFSPEVLENVDAVRKDGMVGFRMWGWSGEALHLYCLFISPDGEQVSKSQYVCLRGKK